MKVAIYGQYYQNSTEPIINDIFVFFNKNNVEMIIESNFLLMLNERKIVENKYKTFTSHTELDSSFDMLISIGGDGTILRAATLVRDSGIPILGINAGRLGFLATVQKENIAEFMQFVIDKKYSISKRALLSLTCFPANESIDEINFAMNEITVSRKDTTSMITIDTYLNDEFLNSYWADGIIVATPTGSTGYSLSCGGPLIFPRSGNFVITPVSPHNLTVRPIVVSDASEIVFQVEGRSKRFLASLDSRVASVDSSVKLKITKADFKVNLVQLEGNHYFKTLRQKLNWGLDIRN